MPPMHGACPALFRLLGFWVLCAALVVTMSTEGFASTVRIGFLNIERESTYADRANVQDETTAYLRRAVPSLDFESRLYSIPELAQAVKAGKVDFFVASSGFFVEMWPYGVTGLATLVSKDFPDPNRCVAGTFFARADREEIRKFSDMAGKILASTNPQNFMSYQIGASALAAEGIDLKRFFSDVQFTNNDPSAVLDAVLSGKADIGLLRTCFLETLLKKRGLDMSSVQVVGDRSDGSRCAYSTPLYPGWAAAAVRTADPSAAEQIAKALLAMPAWGENGYRWSVATNYRSVNDVFRLLQTGPYAHLRHATVASIVGKYWPVLAMLVVGLSAWILHWLSVERLVRRRTAQLSGLLDEQVRLRERALRSSEEAERLTKLGVVNELSSIYAHEMAQPLTSIGYLAKTAKLLLERGEVDRKLIDRCVDKIIQDLDLSQAILQRVRRYAQASGSRAEAVAFSELVESTAASVANLAPGRAMALSIAPNLTVRGDSLELRILVSNLLRNAVRETLSGGGAIQVVLTAEGAAAVLAVSNEAARPVVSRLGDRYVFSSGRTAASAEEAHGLGLGLVIVQSIAKAHRGEFAYEYADGRVIFRIHLPLAVKVDAGAPASG